MIIKANGTRGITLIEMVAVIVVLGLAIPPLLTMWADVAWRSSRAESLADATFYAQALMEEIKSKSFDEKDNPNWTSTADFGPDTGESSNDKDTFDDADDFVGCTDSRVTSPASGYVRSISIDYVRLNTGTEPDSWESCGSISCTTSMDCATCDACCYKRITVSVSRADNLVSEVSIVTMVAAY